MRVPRPLWIIGVILLLFMGAAGIAAWRARDINDRTRRWVEEQLSYRLHSQVELASWSVQVYPRINVVGSGLAIRYQGRTDVPPLIYIRTLSFQIGLSGIINLPRHIARVNIDHMTITIPPREDKPYEGPRFGPPQRQKPPPAVIVDEIVCNDTDLITLPNQAGKIPLDWAIHNLTLHSVGAEKPFSFTGNLTNGIPVGEIATHGSLGPWDVDDPGGTPVSGDYQFTNADLGPFAGIAGILSSTGKYSGPLDKLQVTGETDMPDFSLDENGTPVPLHTEYSATVDGTNGDTYLHPVRATLIRSLITASGSIAGIRGQKGKLITLDAAVPDGRIEDVLRLALKMDNGSEPLLSGPIHLTTKIIIPPGKGDILDKLILDGQFSLPSARWGSADIKGKLQNLSRHALGQPDDEDAGSSVSNLHSRFHLEKSALRLSDLSFAVPGADVELSGTYNLRNEQINFLGHLRLQAKLSQTVTGVKSVFLKVFDPIFARDGAGLVVPIRISGTRSNPKFGLALFGNKRQSVQQSPQTR